MLKDYVESSSRQLEANADRPDLLESRAIARMRWAATQRHPGKDWAAESAHRSAVEDLSNAWQLMFGNHFFNESNSWPSTDASNTVSGKRSRRPARPPERVERI